MFIQPPNINSSDTKAFFTTRQFNEENVPVSKALSAEFNIPESNIFLPVQKHTDRVYVLKSGHERVIADAVISDRENVLIGVIVADCVPVLLYDREKRVIGAVHAGWKGTASQILKEVIRRMQAEFNSLPEDILIAIGPSIRQCSYEVGEDVKEEVVKGTGEGDYFSKRDEKYFIDLSTANKIQALNTGVLPENIWQSGECTFCNPDKFYSYRYLKGSAGRQGGFIGIW
jgi:YfiH family protein